MSEGGGNGTTGPQALATDRTERSIVSTILATKGAVLYELRLDPATIFNPRVRQFLVAALRLHGDDYQITPEILAAHAPEVDQTWLAAIVGDFDVSSNLEDLKANLPLIEESHRDREIRKAASSLTREPGDELALARIRLLADPARKRKDDDYLVDVAEYLGADEPSDDTAEDWTVEGLIPSAAPSAIAGEPKSGKTILAEEICICVAAGIPILGFPVRQGPVLLFPFEDPKRLTQRRLWWIARAHGIDPRSLAGSLCVSDQSLGLDERSDVERLRRSIERYHPLLILIDSLSRIHSGDENSKQDMGVVHKVWGDLAREYECAIVIIHHFAKSNERDKRGPGQRMRGSSDIHALVRQVVGVMGAEEDQVKTISCSGNLDGKPKPFLAELVGSEDRGKKTLSWAHRGNAREYQDSRIREAIVAVLGGNGEGLGAKAVRDGVRALIGRASSEGIDHTLRRMKVEGLIDQAVGTRNGQIKPYRLIRSQEQN